MSSVSWQSHFPSGLSVGEPKSICEVGVDGGPKLKIIEMPRVVKAEEVTCPYIKDLVVEE